MGCKQDSHNLWKLLRYHIKATIIALDVRLEYSEQNNSSQNQKALLGVLYSTQDVG